MSSRTSSRHRHSSFSVPGLLHNPFPQTARPDAKPAPPWPAAVPLFPALTTDARAILERLPEVLQRVRPLRTAHWRTLPEDIAALSRLLTTERAGLVKPYWSNQTAVSAYLYYFLPWNLIRLTRLLTSLPLPEPVTDGKEALLLDVGSGPLTLPLALWLARPQWRTAPVRILALDSSSQPLQLGRTLMKVLGMVTGEPVWPVHTARVTLNQIARRSFPRLADGTCRPWMMSAVNVLNEIYRRRDVGAHGWEQHAMAYHPNNVQEKLQEGGDARLNSMLSSFATWAEQDVSVAARKNGPPALLAVEPGTRLGGHIIMRLRRRATVEKLTVLAPCPHQKTCPLQDRHTWCHFTFDSEGAPAWLTQLSAEAGLAKQGLSVSPLLLTLPLETAYAARTARLHARIISSPLAVPGLSGRARYACSAQGLLLLENAAELSCGDSLSLNVPQETEYDRKSGARIVRPSSV